MIDEDFVAYTRRITDRYDGTCALPPRDLLCPRCGAYVHGDAENVAKHMEHHRREDFAPGGWKADETNETD